MGDVWNEQTGIPGVDNAFDPTAWLKQLGQPGFNATGATGGAPQPTMVAPQVGSQIPGAPPPMPMAPPVPTGPSFMPQLPQPGAPPPAPTPLRTPQVQYYPTKGGARTANILGALQGFREGAQNAYATQQGKAYNQAKMIMAQINSIAASGDPQAAQKIGALVNNPQAQKALHAAGIDLPLIEGTQTAAPSGIRGLLGKVMSGITGVPQGQPTGQVDVNALPQMAPAQQAAAKLQGAQLQQRLRMQEIINALPDDAMRLYTLSQMGMVLSPADQQKLNQQLQTTMAEIEARHQNELDLQQKRDEAAAARQESANTAAQKRTETSAAATKEAARVRAGATLGAARIGAESRENVAGGKAAAQYGTLTPAGQKTMADVDPILDQMKGLREKLKPYEDNNTPGYFTLQRGMYAVGMAPGDAGDLASEIANLELAKVTGAMPYATKSRNFQYIQQIQQHLPNVWRDSPKNVAQKLDTSIANLQRIKDNVARYEVKGAKADGGGTGANSTTSLQQQLDQMPEGAVVQRHKKVNGKWVPQQ